MISLLLLRVCKYVKVSILLSYVCLLGSRLCFSFMAFPILKVFASKFSEYSNKIAQFNGMPLISMSNIRYICLATVETASHSQFIIEKEIKGILEWNVISVNWKQFVASKRISHSK